MASKLRKGKTEVRKRSIDVQGRKKSPKAGLRREKRQQRQKA